MVNLTQTGFFIVIMAQNAAQFFFRNFPGEGGWVEGHILDLPSYTYALHDQKAHTTLAAFIH